MTLEIETEDAEDMDVDRDGMGTGKGYEGFDINIGTFKIHFQNENDAERLGRMICKRLGVDLSKPM